MFCCLVGRKFSKKSKHLVKCINCRIDPIRKKKQALVRFLKKDVADLLAAGYEENAFGRMDELIVEINHASCYDMIEQYCGCVLAHLSTMRKERECPKEAMEAAATLIFAAARFSNLPELAKLRTIFAERYESQLESCINKEFIEKVHKKSFSKDRKLQLMKDIASEFSMTWNSKMFENQILNQTAPTYVQLAKHEPATKENDQHFHEKEVASGNHEHGNRVHKPSPKPQMQKHELQLDERPMSQTPKHRVMVRELANADLHYPDLKAHVNTKYNKNDRRSNDLIFKDRTSTNDGESSHSKSSEDVKDVIHHNGQDRRHNRPVNATNCNTKYNKNDRRRNDLIFEDRTRTNDGESPHSKSSEDVKDVIDHNGQDRQHNKPANAANRRAVNLQPPYVKSKVNKISSHPDYANPRVRGKPNGGGDDNPKDGSVHSMQWDYDNLAAEISALRNS